MEKDNIEKDKLETDIPTETQRETDPQTKESPETKSKQDKNNTDQNQKVNQQDQQKKKNKLPIVLKKKQKTDQESQTDHSKLKKTKTQKLIIIAAAIIIFILMLCTYFYIQSQKQIITIVTTIGNLTFTDKQKTEEEYTITFQAADYNFLPEEINKKGITTHINSEIYDAIALGTEYQYANVVFEVPKSVARKAGFDKEKANTQALWTPEILQKYTKIQTAIWTPKK